MIGSRELEALQVELKKAIQNHHLIRLKLAQESSDSLKDHLKNIQNHIQHLGEKQKRIIAQLREKESSSSSSSSSSRPALAVRTISGETKLLVLVSAAAATAKQKQNQHQQILVVPTPGGGARLATSALSNCSGTLLRHPLRSNGFNSNNSNGCNNNGGSSSGYLNTHQNTSNGNTSGSSYKSVLGGGSSSGCSSVGGGEGSTSGGISIKSTSNQLQQNITRQQLQREQLARQAQLEEERVSEPKRKEGFLAALGLVTKEALTEIQNKKCERKRRTTANPQFSNAAIEAKRISALAVAEKRAKRRMLLGQEAAAASGRGGANNGTNGGRRNFLQSSSSSSSSTTTSTSRNRAQKLRGACAVEQPQPVRQRSGGPGGGGGSSSGRRLDREKSSTTNHSASNGADASTKSAANSNSTNGGGSLSGSKVPKNCFVCDELCDADLDAIMFCKDCRCLFHATCAADIANIKQNLSVPCPKCDKQKPLEEEVLSAPSEESAVSPSGHESAADETELRSVKQEDEKTEEDDEEEAAAAAEQLDDKAEEEEEEDEDEEEERRRPKKGAGEVSGAKVQAESGHTEDDEDNEKEAAEAAAKAKAEDEMEKKLLEEKKVKKDELKRKRDSLDDEVDQCKKRLAELKETLSVEKEHQENLIKEQTVLIDNISKVTSIVELVKNSVPIKVECETEMSSAPMTTGDDDHQSSPSKDTDNTVCTKASDILKTLADGIGRMVPEDKDGVVYDETGSSGSSSGGGGVVHTGEEVHVDNILGKDNMEFHPSVNIINSHVDQQQHQTFRIQNGMVIVGTKALEVIVMDTTSGPGTGKLDQFEDETSAAVASIQGIQDQIEVDFREELLH